MNRSIILDAFMTLQDGIQAGLSSCDASLKWQVDMWDRPGGGGGRTRACSSGEVWEKGGVNFSDVHGEMNPALQAQLKTEAGEFKATGVSLVLHPVNPHVPIVHMNVRHFVLSDGREWFGGGLDLSPHYVDREEARQFHQALAQVCALHAPGSYARFKKEADAYFRLPHRNEARGIGGIFFDELGVEEGKGQSLESVFQWVLQLGQSFLPTYLPLVEAKRHLSWGTREREWQLLRRGRYVEFNLVHDRGTRFGLLSDGRVESILMSLPPFAEWKYNHQPAPDSAEAKTLEWLRSDVDWILESD